MHNEYHHVFTENYNNRHHSTTTTLISSSPPLSLLNHYHRKGPGDLHIDTRSFHHHQQQQQQQPYTPTKGRDEYFASSEMEQPMPVPLPNARAASGLITADGNRIIATTDSVPSLTSSATTALSPEVDDNDHHHHDGGSGDDVDFMAAGSAPLLTTMMMARSHSVNHRRIHPQQQQQHQQSPVRKCQSLATSPARVSCGSWGHIKSPAASFLARFGMPDHLTDDNKKNEDEEIDDYMLEKVIGTGGFATVRRGYCISNGQKVAIKVYTKPKENDTSSSMKRLERELAIWKRLRHDHVLPIHKTVETETSIYAICDYCPGGSLLDLVRQRQRLGEDEARPLFIQLCAAIQYLHDEARVCHKDIKLENVLLDENNRIKLCDFGLAMYCRVIVGPPLRSTPNAAGDNMHNDDGITKNSNTRDHHQQQQQHDDQEEEEEVAGGSLAYSAPEQVLSRTPVASASSDMWSLGVLLYTLVLGRLPFQDDYDPRLQQKILSGHYEIPSDDEEDEVSADLRSLLSNLLQVDPSKRYTIQEVLQSAWCS